MTAAVCMSELRRTFSSSSCSKLPAYFNNKGSGGARINAACANLINKNNYTNAAFSSRKTARPSSFPCFNSSSSHSSSSFFNKNPSSIPYASAQKEAPAIFSNPCTKVNEGYTAFAGTIANTKKNSFINYQSKRTYLHFGRTYPEDYELPMDTMPENVNELMSKDPKNLDFFENYWYWRIRGESTILDAETLPKKSYRQLARDMGMQVINEQTEHMVGLLELYEYLKSSPFVGPFGTVENPVLVPSVHTERIVGCTGGTGDSEHVPLWFRCREGFLYRCGECDQIFMLVKVLYSLPEGQDPFPVDPDVDDVFNYKLIEKGQKEWNSGEYVHWPVGNATYKQLFLEGKWGNEIPKYLVSGDKTLSP